MSDNLTDFFVEHIFLGLTNPIPETVFDQAKMALLDYLGVAFAGGSILKQRHLMYLKQVSPAEDSHVLGTGYKCDVFTAALLNGISAHETEMDDGNRFGMIHLSASIISALLAVCEKEHLEGRQLLKGIIFGYESAVILSSVIQPSHKKRGFHTTGTCGTVGAACGIAVALGYSKKQFKDTLSLSCSSSAGLLEIQEDASNQKPFNPGRAAMDAIMCAYMARAGMNGPDDVLGGGKGFFHAMSDIPVTLSSLETAFNNDYCRISGRYVKLYASCRHCHAPIDSVMKILFCHRIEPRNIESIIVDTYSLAVNGHDHTTISGVNSAKLSIPFSIALAISRKSVSINDFTTDSVKDKDLLEIAKLVQVRADNELSSLVPGKRAAVVTIHTKTGEVFSERTDFAKGEPEAPISKNELEMKYHTLMDYAGINKNEIELIKQQLWTL